MPTYKNEQCLLSENGVGLSKIITHYLITFGIKRI